MRRRLDALVGGGRTAGKTFARVALDHQQALVRAEGTAQLAAAAQAAAANNAERRTVLAANLAKADADRHHLGPQRTIRQLDVDQERILTATKLAAALLISFAIREHLPAAITAETFVARLFSLCGRKERWPTEERVYFYENPRDPEATTALRHACHRLNERQLKHDGRLLQYHLEPPPCVPGRSG